MHRSFLKSVIDRSSELCKNLHSNIKKWLFVAIIEICMANIPISFLYRLFTFKWKHHVFFTESSLEIQHKRKMEANHYSTIVSKPELVNGVFWNQISLHTRSGNKIVISGIKKGISDSLLADLIQSICKYHLKQINSAYNQIEDSIQHFNSKFNNRYAKHSEIEAWKRRSQKLVELLENKDDLDFLPEKTRVRINVFLNLFNNSQKIRNDRNKSFIEEELDKHKEFFDKIESKPLTPRQRLSCIVNEDNTLVIAGAGSGKTSVIISKAGYLIHSKLAVPHEILILAYGRKASKETNERIKQRLPKIEGITTSTFHKLGLDIISSVTRKKPRVNVLQEDPAEFYSLINGIVTKQTRQDKGYNQRIIDYFVNYLVPYEDAFNYDQPGDYFSALKKGDMRSLKSRIDWANKESGRVSLKHEQMKSFEEVVIADFLFVNGISYIYEHPYVIDTSSVDRVQYHPDFFLPEYNIYIEHFGISKEGKTPPFVDKVNYLQGVEWKRRLHRENKTILVETYSYEMKEGVLTDLLYTKLEKKGVKFLPLTFEKLLELLIKIGAEKKASQFTRLIVTFLDLFKQSGHTFDDLRNKADQHPNKPRCHAFIDIFIPIFDKYVAELEKTGTVDFNDMIRSATELIRANKYKSPYKYILVDEFQDISAIRADLLKSLVVNGEETSLMCVGDDWQSIYRFSGSDINYISNFKQNFGFTKKVLLDKTFRYNNKINEFSTTFITQNPAQLNKKVSSLDKVSANAVTLVQYCHDIDRAIQHCMQDIETNHPKLGKIYVLGRYLFSKPDYLQTIVKQYPQYSFMFDTVHGSKGKEADFVIVVDVNDEKYGFPSNIDVDPLLDLVLPQSESHAYAEERRLFYVAITRAKHHAYILFDTKKPSVFVKEIIDGNNDQYEYNLVSTEGVSSAPPDFGNCPSCKTGKIVMRVMNDGRFFFGCENFPFCKYIPRTCESCNKYPLIKEGNIYMCLNPECGNKVKACRECSDGIMLERNGKYGSFLGCSNYKIHNCRYTENLKSKTTG